MAIFITEGPDTWFQVVQGVVLVGRCRVRGGRIGGVTARLEPCERDQHDGMKVCVWGLIGDRQTTAGWGWGGVSRVQPR